MLTGAGSGRARRAGRHHRERLGWLWPRLGAVVEVTVAELVRRAERERACAHRARRVRVVPRQRPAPNTPVTGQEAAGHQNSLRLRGEINYA
ncbi:MAG: hypothetical protein ACRDRS_26435 [Pseudonocardiaceae bacterium]